MKFNKKIVLFWIIILPGILCARNNEFVLPVYQLAIEPTLLEKMNRNPGSDDYYPALFSHADHQYDCELRYRGGTARNLPKKSWRIKFNNTNNIFNTEIVNLNAEYRDRSLMRNHLAMKLFHFSGYPAPATKYVNVFVNNIFHGVYLQIEEVDKHFLTRRDRPLANLYKAKTHGACMAPLTHYAAYTEVWDKQIGEALNFRDLQLLFSKFLYWNYQDFVTHVPAEIDVDNVLNYFAIEFAISSLDCLTKNMFLFYNMDKNAWELVPWDNDTTFGNDIRGNYQPTYVSACKDIPMDHQVLFQRMMEYDRFRNAFREKLEHIIYDGFAYLDGVIDSTYDYIKHDVYLDSQKVCNNTEFDREKDQVKQFLQKRKVFVDSCTCFNKIPLSHFYCSRPYPVTTGTEIVFRVKSASPQPVYLHYVRDLLWDRVGSYFAIKTLQLFDDGSHQDLSAGDLIYGNILVMTERNLGLYPFYFTGSDDFYPANAMFYINYVRTNTFAMNKITIADSFYHQIKIGKIFSQQDDYFVELVNPTTTDIDLSYCHLNSGPYYHNFLLPENTILPKNDTLIITTHKVLADRYFNKNKTIGNFFFSIVPGDTVKLLSPVLSLLSGRVCQHIIPIVFDTARIIINEINYNSIDNFDPEDWIEFYNPQARQVDLAGWYFKDSEDIHIFIFPVNTKIEPNGYLVLCRNNAKFQALFPHVHNFFGNFNFGLDGSGEHIRLFNPSGNIIDSLTYDDNSPWPQTPDGQGPTLELKNPTFDNAIASSWAASANHGTPGTINSGYSTVFEDHRPVTAFLLCQNYPNPFNEVTRIDFTLGQSMPGTLKIYNIKGQLVQKIAIAAGRNSVLWHATGFSAGIYFYQLEVREEKSTVKKALLLK